MMVMYRAPNNANKYIYLGEISPRPLLSVVIVSRVRLLKVQLTRTLDKTLLFIAFLVWTVTSTGSVNDRGDICCLRQVMSFQLLFAQTYSKGSRCSFQFLQDLDTTILRTLLLLQHFATVVFVQSRTILCSCSTCSIRSPGKFCSKSLHFLTPQLTSQLTGQGKSLQLLVPFREGQDIPPKPGRLVTILSRPLSPDPHDFEQELHALQAPT